MAVEATEIARLVLPNVSADGNEGSITEFASALIELAFSERASDIHIEPQLEAYIVRIRVDGRLETLTELASSVGIALVSRYKVMGRLNIVERRRPQDGQFSVTSQDRAIDVRISTVATLYGEKLGLRLLDTQRETSGAAELGMSDRHRAQFESLLRSQHGLVVAAGPTGAGKTTTLHSAINILNLPHRNVITIEDPVEYVIPGVNHLPVHDDINVTFAAQLRAVLRQDPDTILVGETRDAETARISVQAALAGRLVLTSIHATDAVSAIYRFLQMEIEPHLIAASLSGVISQRLVRRVCNACKAYEVPSKAEQILLGHRVDGSTKVAHGRGCEECRGSGYFGRIGVFQILEVSEELREWISQRPEPKQLKELIEMAGVRPLGEEAYDLAAEGLTSVAEAALLAGVDVDA